MAKLKRPIIGASFVIGARMRNVLKKCQPF